MYYFLSIFSFYQNFDYDEINWYNYNYFVYMTIIIYFILIVNHLFNLFVF